MGAREQGESGGEVRAGGPLPGAARLSLPRNNPGEGRGLASLAAGSSRVKRRQEWRVRIVPRLDQRPGREREVPRIVIPCPSARQANT
jgi:hypothetical protein